MDGDTIDVQLTTHDSRISDDTIRVRLADLDSPEMKTLQGLADAAFADAKDLGYKDKRGRIMLKELINSLKEWWKSFIEIWK